MRTKDEYIGKRYETKCVDSSFEGKGVCFVEDFVIFVSSMLPGDVGTIEISYKRNGVYFGKLASLSKLSPWRIKPRCPIASACGGCVYQSLSYEKEKELKRELVVHQLERAHIECDVLSCDGLEEPYHYRNKIQVPFGKDKNGNLIYGFYREKTHEIIPFEDCPIDDPRAVLILHKLLPILREFRIEGYDEKKKEGNLRHALIRTAIGHPNIQVTLVLREDVISGNSLLIAKIQEEIPEITTLYININKKDTNVILGDRFFLVYGPKYLKETLNGMTFLISPNSFFQVNSKMAEILYKTAIDFADIQSDEIVFDAYSGTGAIGLFAALQGAKKVLAVEVVPEAVRDALENAKNNSIKNYSAVVGDATEVMGEMAHRKEKIDVLFMDPPRKGSTLKFLNAVLSLKPKKIVYVSCNPITLVRDLATLKDEYDIKKVKALDLFGRTIHVETVVLLSRKNG